MGKRKITRQQRRTCPAHTKPARVQSPGEGFAAGPGPCRNALAPWEREPGESSRREEKESFASLFGEDKGLPESFSELMTSYLAAPTGREERQGAGPGSAQRRLEYPAPQEELDLHRRTGFEAQHRIESFVQTARGKGLLTLRIITGKGLHSDGPAVLPEVTESKLLELRERGLVLAFRWEKEKKERSGAIIVYLKPPF
jgi:DNA-nicking Smr family endonuclease